MRRLLITGSRDWYDEDTIRKALEEKRTVMIVKGLELADTMLAHHREGFIYPPFIQEAIDAYAKAKSEHRDARDNL